jgi:8-oxo-dGTP pyrophosphatase MutT (NUDIX family)
MANNTKVFETRPKDFNPQVHVAAAYIEVEGKVLLLQLSESKECARAWGVPAGKLEANECPKKALQRELFEETGIVLGKDTAVHALGQLFIRKPAIDYVYHAFKVDLKHTPQVFLSSEHMDYTWVSVNEARKLPLIDGAEEALDFYAAYSKKRRSEAYVNAYLVLRKENKVLLHLRKNTGYCDGFYGLVAGHVESDEPASVALAREAKEEAGIELDPLALRAVHIMHRKTDRVNIDIFFECSKCQGTVVNQEPSKCASLDFAPLADLPKNTIGYIKDALEAISANEFYSEHGWND